MAINSITNYLKYANLQMAAEALYDFNAQLNPTATPGAVVAMPAIHSARRLG